MRLRVLQLSEGPDLRSISLRQALYEPRLKVQLFLKWKWLHSRRQYSSKTSSTADDLSFISIIPLFIRYEGIEDGDLTFNEGDIIEVVDQVCFSSSSVVTLVLQSGEWWRGRTPDGREGFFPYNRVEILRARPLDPSSSELVKSVKTRKSSEKISRVSVELKELRKTKRSQAVFSVRIALESKDQVFTDRMMGDFRKLDQALQILDPQFEFVHILPPNWADEIPLSTPQATDRARSLTKYLAHNTKGREIFDLLILRWARAKKGELRDLKASNKVKLNPVDSRDDVLYKMGQALAYVYQSEEGDVMKWFVGPKKVGDVAQVRYDWEQRDDTEVRLSKWECVLVMEQRTRYDGWWYGQKANGKKGLFPCNYVELLDEAELRKRLKAPKSKRSPTQLQPGSQIPGGSRSKMRSPAQKQVSSSGNLAGSPNIINDSQARDRRIEEGFCVKSVEGYDELRSHGVTLEINGKHFRYRRKHGAGPNKGDLVELSFSAYVWDPQTQQLREFSSSDRLKAPPKGVTSGEAGASGIKMEFVIGRKDVIDGLEDVVQQLESNKKYRAVISPSKGYGDVGSPPEIPGNCFLVYDLTLEKVQRNGSFAPLDRRHVFSVGISRPNVQTRRPQRSLQDFKGYRSMNAKQRKKKERSRAATQNGARRERTGGNGQAYRGKLTLTQVQEIFRQGTYDQYGLNVNRAEDYLTDEEFAVHFLMERAQFLQLPAWQRRQKKKELNIML